jgi:hypothetical protein
MATLPANPFRLGPNLTVANVDVQSAQTRVDELTTACKTDLRQSVHARYGVFRGGRRAAIHKAKLRRGPGYSP